MKYNPENKRIGTMTRGNVIVENIKIGDTHYEFDMGVGVESEVISLPVQDEEGCWTWQNKVKSTGKIIDYLVRPGFEHYSAKLYDYKAYEVRSWI